MLKGLAQDIFRLALRNLVVQPMGNALTNLFSGMKFFASGGRPTPGQPSVVGDGGEPELFVPDVAGTIIPFSKLKSADSNGGAPIFIDARGADRAGMAQLLAYVRQVDRSIEERSVAANFRSARSRLNK